MQSCSVVSDLAGRAQTTNDNFGSGSSECLTRTRMFPTHVHVDSSPVVSQPYDFELANNFPLQSWRKAAYLQGQERDG
ncbi:hypothetical protein VTO42DRAFT_2428 [Malbranchea cinnamomea]